MWERTDREKVGRPRELISQVVDERLRENSIRTGILGFLKKNTSIDIFTYHTIHPVKVYNSIVFSIFTNTFGRYQSFGAFSSPQKETLRYHHPPQPQFFHPHPSQP